MKNVVCGIIRKNAKSLGRRFAFFLLFVPFLVFAETNSLIYTVTFDLCEHGIRTGGGKLIQSVTNAFDAVEPEVVSTHGWAFIGWDRPFTNVTTDLLVTAQYKRLDEQVDYYVCRGRDSLQNAIEMAEDGSTILVFDGTYGPIDTFTKTLTIRSVNGPERTFISAGWGRCALLGVIEDSGLSSSVFDFYVESFGTTLEGFTLQNGSCSLSIDGKVDAVGGGVAGGILRDCKIVGCDAYLGGGAFQSSLIRCEIQSCWADSFMWDVGGYVSQHTGMGGGAYGCTLDNCLVCGCSADGDSGGLIQCDVFSCTIVGNGLCSFSAVRVNEIDMPSYGGLSAGINFCNVSNSVIWGNVEYIELYDENCNPLFDQDGNIQICERQSNCYYIGEDGGNRGFFVGNCTYPIPSSWSSSYNPVIENNITNNPCFVDVAHDNYRLRSVSPCIDMADWSATNAVVDLDGNPRLSGRAPDIGAYEFQFVVDPIPELSSGATTEEVMAALSGSADAGLAENITNAVTYTAYREWALSVTNVDGTAIAGAQAVKDSPYAWPSFALGADRLIGREIMSNDVHIVSFGMGDGGGVAGSGSTVGDRYLPVFVFEVAIDGVNIGGGIVEEEILKSNLKKVFRVEGSTILDSNVFSAYDIEIIFDEPIDGKARFTATPLSNLNNPFFMRVKVEK